METLSRQLRWTDASNRSSAVSDQSESVAAAHEIAPPFVADYCSISQAEARPLRPAVGLGCAVTTLPYDYLDGDPDDGRPMVINVPSAEGTLLGRQLARFADAAEPGHRERNPGAPRRCGECAYRRGTFPNRCLSTVANALKCAVEGEPFLCHVPNPHNQTETNGLCAGWLILNGESKGEPTAEEKPRAVIELPPIGGTT